MIIKEVVIYHLKELILCRGLLHSVNFENTILHFFLLHYVQRALSSQHTQRKHASPNTNVTICVPLAQLRACQLAWPACPILMCFLVVFLFYLSGCGVLLAFLCPICLCPCCLICVSTWRFLSFWMSCLSAKSKSKSKIKNKRLYRHIETILDPTQTVFYLTEEDSGFLMLSVYSCCMCFACISVWFLFAITVEGGPRK